MMSLTAAYRGDAGTMQGNQRFLLGVGVSIAVHLMLVLAYRASGPSQPALEPDPPSSIAIRILPPPPAPAPAQAEAPAQAQPRAEPSKPRTARKSAPEPVIAIPASPQQEGAADAFTVQQADEAAPAPGEAPAFDMNAAKQTARQLAGQTKLGREGWANAQFPDPPLETESKLAKAISKAKRRDCKDGVPGGLLAPLLLMMDKKNHGCKW